MCYSSVGASKIEAEASYVLHPRVQELVLLTCSIDSRVLSITWENTVYFEENVHHFFLIVQKDQVHACVT
jgi:hypothetical protein